MFELRNLATGEIEVFTPDENGVVKVPEGEYEPACTPNRQGKASPAPQDTAHDGRSGGTVQ